MIRSPRPPRRSTTVESAAACGSPRPVLLARGLHRGQRQKGPAPSEARCGRQPRSAGHRRKQGDRAGQHHGQNLNPAQPSALGGACGGAVSRKAQKTRNSGRSCHLAGGRCLEGEGSQQQRGAAGSDINHQPGGFESGKLLADLLQLLALLWLDQAALDGPEDPFAGADGCVGLHAGIEQRPIFFADEMSNGLVRPVLNGSEQGF